MSYSCETCKFLTPNKTHFIRHMDSKKHENNTIIADNQKLRKENQDLLQQLERQNVIIDGLNRELENLKNIVKDISAKPSTVNNFVFQPIIFSEVTFDQLLPSIPALLTDPYSYYQNIYKCLLSDQFGNPKIKCTDLARQIIKYQDENEKVIKDVKFERFTKTFRHYYDTPIREIEDTIYEKHSDRIQALSDLKLRNKGFVTFIANEIYVAPD